MLDDHNSVTPTPSISGRDAIFVTICSGALLEMAQICEISPNFPEFWPSIPTNREMLAAVFRPLDQNAPRKVSAKQSCWLYPRECGPDADQGPGAVWLYSELWSSPDVRL